jgi:hypothetical protein
MVVRSVLAFGVTICVLWSRAAVALDVPVPGRSLTLRVKGDRETLVVRLSDPSIPLVTPGGPDDPTVTGLSLALFGGGATPETTALPVPAGIGNPGWAVQGEGRYRYRNGEAPDGSSTVRVVRLRAGKIQIAARAIGLTLDGTRTSVGVRIEMGTLRVCTLFAGLSVRRDEPGRFSARSAVVPELQSCSDEALTGLSCGGTVCGGLCPAGQQCAGYSGFDCDCIPAAQPCGDSAPACNGECPVGEECSNTGGVPYYSCACLPAGTVGCGTTYPTCGGDCPAGLACLTDTFTCCGGTTISGCACLSGPPPPPCDGPCPPGTFCAGPVPGFPQDCYPMQCSGLGSCPAGSTCEALGGGLYCLPIACSGGTGYPTCGGTCDSGLTCTAFPQHDGACYCAP